MNRRDFLKTLTVAVLAPRVLATAAQKASCDTEPSFAVHDQVVTYHQAGDPSGWPGKAGQPGRTGCTVQPRSLYCYHAVITGRLSSRQQNLQNGPKNCFIRRPYYERR